MFGLKSINKWQLIWFWILGYDQWVALPIVFYEIRLIEGHKL